LQLEHVSRHYQATGRGRLCRTLGQIGNADESHSQTGAALNDTHIYDAGRLVPEDLGQHVQKNLTQHHAVYATKRQPVCHLCIETHVPGLSQPADQSDGAV